MSGCPRLVWALYRPDLSCGARNVLVHMANVCDPQLICRDPMTKIARLFGMSVRTVMRYVRELEERGFVETRRRFREVNAYRVLVPESEDAKRANGPASYSNGHDTSTQLLDGDKSGSAQLSDGDKTGITQPLDGDKMRTSTPVNSDKFGQSGPINGDKNGTLLSPREESPSQVSEALARPRPPALMLVWEPDDHTLETGRRFGFSPEQIAVAAETMRDWVRSGGRIRGCWNARFRLWLRDDVERQRSRRKGWDQNPVGTLQQEWELQSHAMGHYDPEEFSAAIRRVNGETLQ